MADKHKTGLGPHIDQTARVINTVSTVLGILFALWVPAVIIWQLMIIFGLFGASLNAAVNSGDFSYSS